MIFNILSIIGLILSLLIYKFLIRVNGSMSILRVIALMLLIYKVFEYIYKNINGLYAYPIEISTVTYFMFSIIVLFNIKPAFNIASFFAILSGIGFFIYYSVFGFMSSFYFGLEKHIIAVICHGILLFGGLYLFKENKFKQEYKINIYIMILAIIAHASLFYIESIKNTTFIYFIVKPEFLELFSRIWINHILKVFYYISLFMIFGKLTSLFYYHNQKIHVDTLIRNQYK